MLTCLKCGFESDVAAIACPKCSAIYSKVKAHRDAQDAVRAAALKEYELAKEAKEARDAKDAAVAAEKAKRESLRVATLPNSVVKVYRGTRNGTLNAFRSDAQRLLQDGYTPTSQEYIEGKHGILMYLAAVILIPFVVGFFLLVYLMLVPANTLSVTYTLTAPRASTAALDSKTCPECAETVKSAAKVCRFCGFKF